MYKLQGKKKLFDDEFTQVRITKTGLVEELSEQFVSYLEKQELIVNEGVLVDASFTVAPRQRNTKQENKQVKEGKGDQLWN